MLEQTQVFNPAGLTTRRRADLAGAAATLAVVVLGTLLLYTVAFAQPDPLHDAAHDTRHAFGQPCH